MKSFKQYTFLTEATDVSTALETVLGVCYQAASDSKNSEKILKNAMSKDKQFKVAKQYWNIKGLKTEDKIANLMTFGNNILKAVGTPGTVEFQDHGTITKDWAKWANKSGKDTSKTDIILGGKQYSVKNASGAQLMSGKKGESIATATAAAEMTGMTAGVHTEIVQAMNKLEAVTTEGYYASVEHLKILKANAPGMKIFDYATQEKEKYEKALAAWDVPGALKKDKPRKPPASILKIANNPDKAALQPTTIDGVNEKFLKQMEGDFQDNANEVKDLLDKAFKDDSDYKLAFVFEAATGRYKFGNQVQQAKHMLCWKPARSGVQDFVVKAYPVANIKSKVIKDYASQIALDVNWKSSSTSKHLGYNAYQNVRLGLRDTVQKEKELATEQYKEFTEYTQLLTEGVISEGAFWDKVKEITNKFVEKAKAVWNSFLNILKEAIDKIKDAAKDGLEALSNIMGFEMEVNDTLLNNNSLRLKI